jgi:hypothetical protein
VHDHEDVLREIVEVRKAYAESLQAEPDELAMVAENRRQIQSGRVSRRVPREGVFLSRAARAPTGTRETSRTRHCHLTASSVHPIASEGATRVDAP